MKEINPEYISPEYLIKLKSGKVIPFKSGWVKKDNFLKKDIDKIYKIKLKDTIFIINNICQLNCFFCRDGFRNKQKKETKTLEDLRKFIDYNNDTISFEGGEPTLSKNELLDFLKYAKARKVRERILVTNAVLLYDINYCKELIESGVTLYNINVGAHTESTFINIYQSPVTLFHLRNKGIRNLINLGQGEKIRFNFVINKISYKYLFSYAVWVYTNFPEIFYIEFNFVKLLGKSTKLERDVMPSYIEIYPYLIKALKFCEKVGIKIIVEGIPLCYLRGYEHLNIDVHKYIKGDYTFIAEKQKFGSCDNCSLYDVCSGARLGYSLYYGDEHFKSINNLSINDIKGNIDLYNKKIFLYQKFKSYVRK